MANSLLSVGLDVGTTTTQLILSRLEVENRAGAFAVPQLEIARRQLLSRSPVHFTPLLGQDRVDAQRIKALVAAAYEAAGITREAVDTGAIIITGETSRRENAAAVLQALAGFAGDFVAATAGPHLESVLAAKGAGAVDYSRQTGRRLLHMDMGGGTTNLALIEAGEILRTGCLNVGGRLIRRDAAGWVAYVSEAVADLTPLRPGRQAEPRELSRLAELLTQALEMAAGLRPPTALLDRLQTREATPWQPLEGAAEISFSGGVADCLQGSCRPGQFGDIGVELARAVAESRLFERRAALEGETIGATVIGAGCHSATLSGSTVFLDGVTLPLKNLPVEVFSAREQDSEALPACIEERLARQDSRPVVLALPGYPRPGYRQVTWLAERLARVQTRPLVVCLRTDMAKALGQKLRLLLPKDAGCLCLDGISLPPGSYLDVGRPVGPALPVVIKTLILERAEERYETEDHIAGKDI